MTPARRANLTRLLSPRHIAFVGGRDAEVAIKEAERRGFRGAIWAVNPRRDALGGHPCHRALADLPEAPDAVFLAVPAPAAVEAVAELARMGAGGIVCYTAGFREAGAAGADLERRLIEAAGDMALIGPNCYGLINYLDGAALWPFAHGGTCPGWGAAIITQSGMLSSDITMAQRSLPLTHMISGGNQSVLTIEDFVDHLADHPAVRAIGIHIEGLRDVQAFEAACLKALDRGVPVVALKTGSSRIGASLTVSHTGSLSGADDLHNALFDRCGVIRVKNPSELLETLKFLCVAGVPGGNRVAGFTCSGGGATMLRGWLDTQLDDVACAFVPAVDGRYRCLPVTGSTDTTFADAACTVPALVVDACAPTPTWARPWPTRATHAAISAASAGRCWRCRTWWRSRTRSRRWHPTRPRRHGPGRCRATVGSRCCVSSIRSGRISTRAI